MKLRNYFSNLFVNSLIVGAGVVKTAWDASYASIQVGAQGSISGANVGINTITDISHGVYADGVGKKFISTGTKASSLQQFDGGLIFSTAPAGTLGGVPVWTDRIRVLNTGEVGIGVIPNIWTLNDRNVLQIGGMGSLYGGIGAGSTNFIGLGNNVYVTSGGALAIATGASSVYLQQEGKHIFSTAISVSANDPVTLVERLHINAEGNVGLSVVPEAAISTIFAGLRVGVGGIFYSHKSVGSTPFYALGQNMAPGMGTSTYLTDYYATRLMVMSGAFIFNTADSGIAGNLITWKEGIRIQNGYTYATPTLSFSGSITSGIYGPAANKIAMCIAGSERFKLDVNGLILSNSNPAGNYTALGLQTYATNSAYCGLLSFMRSHTTTYETLSETLNGDTLGIISFGGVCSGSLSTGLGARITCLQIGNSGASFVPVSLTFSIASSTYFMEHARMSFNSDGCRVLAFGIGGEANLFRRYYGGASAGGSIQFANISCISCAPDGISGAMKLMASNNIYSTDLNTNYYISNGSAESLSLYNGQAVLAAIPYGTAGSALGSAKIIRVISDGTMRVPSEVYSNAITGRPMKVSSLGDVGADTSSSERYKINIVDMEDASFIYDLKPKMFEFKKVITDFDKRIYLEEGDGILRCGLIAEDVYKLISTVVYLDAAGRPEGIEYDKLVPAIIKIIIEHKDEIEALKKLLN